MSLASKRSYLQHQESSSNEWGLVAWYLHPFFVSVGLSQVAGCCIQSPAVYLFSTAPQIHFLCSLIKSILDVWKSYFI